MSLILSWRDTRSCVQYAERESGVWRTNNPSMEQQKELIVKRKYNGWRLDRLLIEVFSVLGPDTPKRSIVQGLIQDGLVLVNERAVRSSYRVKPGERILYRIPAVSTAQVASPLTLPDIPIVYEDARLLVLDKPAGLAMHPSHAGQRGTLTDWVTAHYPRMKQVGGNPLRPGMVHRLDKETSGLVVLAKTKRSFEALKSLFLTRRVTKQYTALVHGAVKEKKGRIQAPIGRVHGSLRRGIKLKKRKFSGDLRESLTEYELSTSYPQYSLLSVKPKTGRTHQIRVHLSSIEHPVVGDRLYSYKKHRQDPLNPPHQLLHASELAFTLSEKEHRFVSPLPSYFSRILKTLSSTS